MELIQLLLIFLNGAVHIRHPRRPFWHLRAGSDELSKMLPVAKIRVIRQHNRRV